MKNELLKRKYETKKIKVFVYGTLLEGFGNHRLLKYSKKINKVASIRGFTMYKDYGAFPVIQPSHGDKGERVFGELYEIDDVTLQGLDLLEGYVEGRDGNLYERIVTDVFCEDDYGNEFYYDMAYVYVDKKSYFEKISDTNKKGYYDWRIN